MSWGAVIVGGAAIVGAVVSSNASDKAADAQSSAASTAADAQTLAAMESTQAQLEAARIGANATTRAAELASQTQLDMYYQTREDQLPWLQAGTQALGVLEEKVYAGPGEFEESPGYQFRLEEGNKNILSTASATGGVASGRTLKAIQEYGQDYASNEYDKFLSRYYQSLVPLQSLAGVGQSTATSLASQGGSVASGIADTQMTAGTNIADIYNTSGIAQASGYTNVGNVTANQAITQGNISAQNTMNQANTWTGLLESGASGLASYIGGSSTGAGTSTNPNLWALSQ